MSRTDQYVIHLTRQRDGKDFKTWKTHSGGDPDSAETFTRDAYGLPRKPLGAPQTLDTIKCSRTFYPETDDGQLEELKAGCGRDMFIVNKQKLSVDGHAVGSPDIRNAMLKSCKQADVNVGDDSPSADEYTIELTPEG
jgi:hypothetical protein